MDCERVAELLPWLMNGTLESSEQRLVREHLMRCQGCQRELAQSSFAWSVYQQHVPTQALVNIAYDRPIIAAERNLFERHVEACPDCAEQLEMVRESRRLEAQEEKEEAAQVVPLASKRVAWWQRAHAWQYGALAASLLIVIAVGGWLLSWQQARSLRADSAEAEKVLRERLADLERENERLRQTEARLNQQQDQSNGEIAQLRAQIEEAQARIRHQKEQTDRELARAKGRGTGAHAPQVNILALDIYPVGLTQRAERATSNEIAIPRNVKAVTLILNSQAPPNYRSHDIEIVNPRGKVVWSASGLVRNSTSDYTISVPADYFAPGSYTINVFGEAAGQRTKVESYQIKVVKL